jgi:hypothetical protein
MVGNRIDSPGQCRYVREMLDKVYRNDAEARGSQTRAPAERFVIHPAHSGSVMGDPVTMAGSTVCGKEG